jgi:hypothetical protein
VITREIGRKLDVIELSPFLSSGEMIIEHHDDGTLPKVKQSWNRVHKKVSIVAEPSFHISFGMRSFPAALLGFNLLSANFISKTLISASRIGSLLASDGTLMSTGV